MISPLAHVDPSAQIGKNVTIHPFAYIEGDVVIGDNCEIMSHASILNGTRLGNNNKIYHNSVLGAAPQDFHFTGEQTSLTIGDDNVIRENVVISRALHTGETSSIGNNNHIMDGVHICHNVQISHNCVLGLKSIIAGDCAIEECTILSNNVLLQQHVHVGKWVLIQSGSRIAKHVPPYIIMSGNPPTYHGINAYILQHNTEVTEKVLRHIINAYRLIYQGNFSLQDALQKIREQVPMGPEIEDIIAFIKSNNEIVR